MAANNATQRLRLSQILAVLGLIALIGTYVLGSFMEYHDPVTGELEFDEDNLSFQPLKMFLPEDVEYRDTEPVLAKHIGDIQYEYFPEGAWAYVIGYQTMPIWRVSLEAPQYPKSTYPDGLPVFFTLTDFKGKVVEMNVINHYIGMDPMDIGAFTIRKFVPLIYLVFVLMLLGFIFYSGPGYWLLGLIPALMPWYYLGIFSYWLYWFGHNLHDYGAFTIKPFMPTVLGDGKVAQFTTHSYPTTGFYLLLVVFITVGLAILIKRKALRDLQA